MTKHYQDFSLNFRSHPITNDLSLVSDEKAIEQSMKNLVLCDKYDIPFKPKQAGHIRALLFDLVTPFLTYDVESRVKSVIENYEPRVKLLSVLARVLPDANQLHVTIVYRAKTSTSNITLDFYLDRVV
jgi:phage baseplate assembly protein W